MIDTAVNAVKLVLEQSFDKVVGLYDSLNMNEHKNENLCFVGIDGYTFSKPVVSGNDVSWTSRVKYLVKALGGRNMNAETLCGLIDGTVVPALKTVSGVSEISRGEALYLREQGRYCVSCEIIFADSPPAAIPAIVSFAVGTVYYPCMNSFKISRIVKTGETPTIDNGIRSRIVGVRPAKITVKGEGASVVISSVYSTLSSNLGSVVDGGITVGGIAFSDVAMTELTLDSAADGISKITVVFTEVNET